MVLPVTHMEPICRTDLLTLVNIYVTTQTSAKSGKRMKMRWRQRHSPTVTNRSVVIDRLSRTAGDWWIVVVRIFSFLVERTQQLLAVCMSLPVWHSSCCLTKEVKDLGLSEPLSRAWNWAADLLTAQNCVIADSAQLVWDATCWVIGTSQVHFKTLHCFHLLYSFVKQTLM